MADQDEEEIGVDLVFTQTNDAAGIAPVSPPSDKQKTLQNPVPADLLGPSSAAPPDADAEKPTILGRYTLERLLGRGGMAEVFLAKQDGPAGFQKTCVVKRIRKSLVAEEKFVDMFLREARVAARLNHANTVQIFELGQEGDEYFIAMEYLDGITLHRSAKRCWAAEESMSMEVVLRCIADAAQGLHHAHTLRDEDGKTTPLIHRDISPDNLMLTRDGVTKVLDFGIAKSGESDEMTRTGELKGKIPFMSPEQIMGETLDGRSDLWALGVTFYWLLTGQRPFDGKSDHMTIDHILRKEPTPPRELNPLIPAPVQKLILSLLVKNRDQRLSTGAQLHDLIVSLLGPAAGNTAAAEFAQKIMAAPAQESKVAKKSLLTCIAARPESAWLKRSDENEDLLNLIPPVTPIPGQAIVEITSPAPTVLDSPSTDQTLSGMHPQSQSQTMTRVGQTNSLKGAMIGVAGIVVVLGLAVFVVIDPKAETAGAIPASGQMASNGLPAQGEAPQKPDPKPAETKTATEETDAKPAAPEVAEEKPVQAAVAPQSAGENKEKTSSRSSRKARRSSSRKADKAPSKRVAARESAPPPASAATKRIRARGPASVIWKISSGKTLGRGSAPLDVPESITALQAVDSQTGGKNTVPIVNRVADYDSLGKGGLVFRVRPWADIRIGKKNYGTTPIDPIRLVAGTYRVTLKWKEKKITKTVRVRKGQQESIKIDMRK